jgi:hypothetical protein
MQKANNTHTQGVSEQHLEQIRMPRFFPTVLEPCKEKAARFFYCFTSMGEMTHAKVSSFSLFDAYTH